MWKKGINFVFVGLILCGLLLGLARTVFFPKKINYYENRYANRAALPTPGTYADGTFQDQLEAALGDQTPFAERFKARYNDLSSKLTKALLKPVRWLYTAFFVLIGWVLFDLTDFPSLCHALKLMFVPQATDWVAAAATNVSLLKAVVYLPLGIVCCLPLLRREPKSAKGILLADLASGLLLIVCIVFILSSSYNPFIYFRF